MPRAVLLAAALSCGRATAGPRPVRSSAEPPTALPSPRSRDGSVPLSGGTLHVSRDRRTIVASDPDRDRVWMVDVPTLSVAHEVELEPGDEPGRIAEDAFGRIHVVMR